MKVYISGRIGSRADREQNIATMRRLTEQYRATFPHIYFVSPLEVASMADSWEEAMRKDIIALCECDGIILLPGWKHSPGAHLELHIASRIGLKMYLSPDELSNG